MTTLEVNVVIAVKFPISLGMLPVKYWLLIVRAVRRRGSDLRRNSACQQVPVVLFDSGYGQVQEGGEVADLLRAVPGALDAPS